MKAPEDAVYDSQAIRRFVGIDLNREGVPDATTLLNFAICWKHII
jgi:IS5 family transposase